MARLEVNEESRDLCPCGNGNVIVLRYDPEYMYGRAYWRAGIACPTCQKTHKLQETTNGRFRLIKRFSPS